MLVVPLAAEEPSGERSVDQGKAGAVPTQDREDTLSDTTLPLYANVSDNVQRDLGRVYQAVREARRIAVVCGAGISVSSPANIPDFRSTTGLFTKLKQQYPDAGLSSGKDLFDARLFNSDASTALFYNMMAELKDLADAAKPTRFHYWLKTLDEEGRLQRVYTQNIDGLEAKAGLSFGFDQSQTEASATKRKRSKFARSQSDSVLMQGKSEHLPMFSRAIPLHGNLYAMSCALCSYTLSLADDRPECHSAIESMRMGRPVWCAQCESNNQIRVTAGLRSRAVGRMKVDVVLYNGENDTAERVGACVERDLLGLRDPNEPQVPETLSELRARVRKQRGTAQRTQSLAMQPCGSLSGKPEEPKGCDLDTEQTLSMNANEKSSENVLGSFFDDEEIKENKPCELEPPKPSRSRLKPLPPDLLIVAGTSLKVPGTKRLVREFAKACRARDANKTSCDNPPIRTLYLNYDFPTAAREWDGIFDVWIQGDVQQTASGLGNDPDNDAALKSWSVHLASCKEQEAASLPLKCTKPSRSKQPSIQPSRSRSKSSQANQPRLNLVSQKLSTSCRSNVKTK
ncbi:hypothetical protein MPSI1_001861 [Malassezia psittaci]|uniref:Deacetylase sirtuin-type domain-containing protein n=1 Tax=Malassezia psittaci TaxID=1821823 RepID=A0AAF0F542_9BASI|nr:hypothetical protein MPSI1_001861 [Malassezia psittaci]